MIRICNQLWTRKCNLSCGYCRIALTRFGDYVERPNFYPDKNYYMKNEKSGDWWCELNTLLYKHNPECFSILYGGEIFLHPDHVNIVKHMNNLGSEYTIISSANDMIRPTIDKFFEQVGQVKGFTCSIDPGFYKTALKSRSEMDDDETYKAHKGYAFLKYLIQNNLVKDPVAEITADCNTIFDLPETVRMLSEEGITSDITVLDVAHTNAYDFSAITDPKYLVPKTEAVKEIFQELKRSDYKIHMKDLLMESIYDLLPSNGDCELERELHNITVDSDGKLRLCLRIRGKFVNGLGDLDALNLFDEDGTFGIHYQDLHEALKADKESLCKGCSWSCVHMSKSGDSHGIINH